MKTKKDAELTEAENYNRTARNTVESLGGVPIDLFVYEAMVARKGRFSVVKDLIALTAVSGSVIGTVDADRVAFVTPRWTGNRAKKINHLLIRKRLDDVETRILERALTAETATTHHKEILDAVGIGLFMQGRL